MLHAWCCHPQISNWPPPPVQLSWESQVNRLSQFNFLGEIVTLAQQIRATRLERDAACLLWHGDSSMWQPALPMEPPSPSLGKGQPLIHMGSGAEVLPSIQLGSGSSLPHGRLLKEPVTSAQISGLH